MSGLPKNLWITYYDGWQVSEKPIDGTGVYMYLGIQGSLGICECGHNQDDHYSNVGICKYHEDCGCPEFYEE